MKGESIAIEQLVDSNQNASQLYASMKGWHVRDSEGESISDLQIAAARGLFTAGKGRPVRKRGGSHGFGCFGYYIDLSLSERDGGEGSGRTRDLS
jgi:hypothetical protein